MRILNFSDGFESNSEPNLGIISTNNLYKFVNDAAFVAYKGLPASAADIYFNTSLGIPRLFNGTHWVSVPTLDENGNFVVPGNLSINGTMTVINTENLEIKDKNITLNKGGSDLTSQGAGFTVEREGDDGSLIYDSEASSKWKAGDKGAEVEVITATHVQTLSNKTLVSPEITSPTGLVKSDVGLSNVNNTSDMNKPVSTAQATAIQGVQSSLESHVNKTDNPHEVTKAQVGLGNVDNTSDAAKNSAQTVLTNKDIDGGTASNSNRITLPKNTKTNLDGLSRKQGTLCYSTTDNKLYFDDGVALFPLASEAASIPAGVVLPYAGSSTPSGYLPCLGQAVSRTTYAALFLAIGTQYGSGDGSTTFNLPNPQALALRFAGDQTYNSVTYSAYLGEKRNDAIQNITGSIAAATYQRLAGAKTGVFGNISGGTAQDTDGTFNGAKQSGIDFDASRVVRTDTQTHGADMAFNGIIKY